MNILYLGIDKNGKAPADRRRFLAFAARVKGLKVYFNDEIGIKFDILVCSLGGDLIKALRLCNDIPFLVFDYTNHYLVEDSWFLNRFRIPVSSLVKKREWSSRSFNDMTLEIMKRANLIICPSITQQNDLRCLGIDAERATDFFGDEVDFQNVNFDGDQSLFWEGQSGNLASLKIVGKALTDNFDTPIKVVSDKTFGRMGGRFFKKNSYEFCKKYFANVEFYEWNRQHLNDVARKSSLGIIPINIENKLYAAKPENKLILMWMLGLPALCSPTDSYQMLADETGVNFICKTDSDWRKSIDQYLCNNTLRGEIVRHLYNYALNHYSDDMLELRWQAAFEKVSIL